MARTTPGKGKSRRRSNPGIALRRAELHVVLSDLQVPYHDPIALGLVLDWICRHQPHTIHLLGDLIDFYPISNHLTDPSRSGDLQRDVDQAGDVLTAIRIRAQKARVELSEGNHENRLARYLWRKAEELSHLRALRLSELLELPGHRIRYHTEQHPYKVGDLWLTHGSLVRKHSAYTARAMVEKVGGSVIIGHTHRLGSHYVSTWGNDYAGYENGCLCQLKPCLANAYVKGSPNWQQGFSVLWRQGKHTQVLQVPIVKGKYIDPLTGKQHKG